MRRLFVIAALCGLTTLPLCPATATDSLDPTDAGRTPLVESYLQALAVDPDYLPLHYFLGVALLTEGRSREAIAELSRAYPAYADSVEMQYNLGLAYARAGDLDSAQLYYERAEELGALDQTGLYPLADAYFNLALAHLEAGTPDEADRLFARVLSLDPQRFEVHRLRGDLLARRGETAMALAEFDAYLRVYPDDQPARDYAYSLHINRALQLLDAKDPAGARSGFEQALAAHPGAPLPRYYLGYLDYSEGNIESAAARLIEARPDAQPEVAESIDGLLYNCATTLLQQRKSRQALAAIAPLLDRPEAPARLLYLAGSVHLERKEFAQARGCFQRVLRLEPAHRGAALALVATEAKSLDELIGQGDELMRSGDYREALDRLEEALAINPADPRARALAERARTETEKETATRFAAAEQALQAAAMGEHSIAQDRQAGVEARLAATVGQEVQQGRQAMSAGRYVTAREHFAKALALKEDPSIREELTAVDQSLASKLETLLAAARQAQAKRDFKRARNFYGQALDLAPEDVVTRQEAARLEAQTADEVRRKLAAANTEMAARNLRVALDLYRQILEIDPANREAQQGLQAGREKLREELDRLIATGTTQFDRGEVGEAEATFSAALALDPYHQGARAALKRVSQAKKAGVQPGDAQELYLQGIELYTRGKYGEAVAAWEQVLLLSPGHEKARMNIDKARRKLRRIEEYRSG